MKCGHLGLSPDILHGNSLTGQRGGGGGGGGALLFRDDQVKHANVLYERKVSLLPPRSVEASRADCLPMLKAS